MYGYLAKSFLLCQHYASIALIVSSNLDGLNLANYGQLTKFAKLSHN